jgi:hypothetical protein
MADRDPVQRRAGASARDLIGSCLRLGPCPLRRDRDPRLDRLVVALDPRQTRIDDFHRRKPAFPDELGRLGDREIGDVVGGTGPVLCGSLERFS